MADVAVAEGDAAKGEIVISPIVHHLLHNYTSQRATPRKPVDRVSGKSTSGADSGTPDPSVSTTAAGDTHQHILSCGCERTPSGYFKIRNSLEDMLCAVDFAAAPAASTPTDAQTPSEKTRSTQEAAEQQYEFDTYAQIVDELMAGFRAVTPHLKAEFATVVDTLRSELQAEKSGESGERWTCQ